MKPQTLLSVCALLVTLQGATLAYVVKIENRLTRLETIQEVMQRGQCQRGAC